MGRSLSLKIVALLALAQGTAGLLRALDWMHVGVDLFGEGLLLLPFLGVIAFVRGLLIAAAALLYMLFAGGALDRPCGSNCQFAPGCECLGPRGACDGCARVVSDTDGVNVLSNVTEGARRIPGRRIEVLSDVLPAREPARACRNS